MVFMNSHNTAIRDAFNVLAQTNNKARTILVETKKAVKEDMEHRISEILDLAYEAFCGDLRPVGKGKAQWIYSQAKGNMVRIAREGGDKYNETVTSLQFASTSEDAWRIARDKVLPALR
jgi:hypothetical protein